MRRTRRSIQFVALAAGLSLLEVAAVASAGPVQDLPGRWTGWGTVNLTSGNKEQVKCVATYFVQDAGATVQQNLRCASSSYKIDASTNLKLKGAQVTGTWEEKSYNATGSITGQMSGSGFNLAIKGENFTAAMNLSTSACKQSVNITPQGLDVTRVSINLSKC